MMEMITLSIDKKHRTMLEILAEKNDSDKSKTIRRLIREGWDSDFNKELEKRLNGNSEE